MKSEKEINFNQVMEMLNEQNRVMKEIQQHLSDIEKLLNEKSFNIQDQRF